MTGVVRFLRVQDGDRVPPTEVGATAFWLAIRDVHAALAAWREGKA